jgi:predicted TIM-barrel fold metal-dependent hydrolase
MTDLEHPARTPRVAAHGHETTANPPVFDLGWLVSVDDHVLEPSGVWQDRVASRYRDVAPRLVRDHDSGTERWRYEDMAIDTVGLAGAAGRALEHLSMKPLRYDEMRPGCYDPVARIADMDTAGILASMCFPSFPRFCGQVFLEAKDKVLALVCVQAYNDWMIDQWCASAPGRFIPLVLVPLWDPYLAAQELERCASKGARAFAFSENPTRLGLPSLHDPNEYWGPMLRTANDLGMVVCTHVGSASYVPTTADDAPAFVSHTWMGGVSPSGAMLDWLFSGWFQRLPDLKLALSEGGIGWMPYFVEHAEYVLGRHRYWAQQTAKSFADSADLSLTLSIAEEGAASTDGLVRYGPPGHEVDWDTLDIRQTFRDHVYGCFIQDFHGIRSIDEIGVDNIMVETDYPHSDSSWPNSIALAREQLTALSESDAYKVLRGNAERLFQFVPADAGSARPELIGRSPVET